MLIPRRQGRSVCAAIGFAGGALAIGAAGPVEGSIIDLTSGPGSSGTVNGGVFQFGMMGASGTGNLDAFLRIQSNGTEQGYNTSNSDPGFDEKTGTWTHDLLLSQIPIVNHEGQDYYEFLLDINESLGGGNSFLSLDALKIYTTDTPSQNTTNLNALGTLRWDMDAGSDSHVRLDAVHNSGSGETDMTALIPVSAFAGADPDDYLVLYSHFGGEGNIGGQKYGSSDGFEEWAVNVIPAPGALALLGLAGFAASRRRRRTSHLAVD